MVTSTTPPQHVAVRVDGDVIERLDKLAAQLSTDWHAATRSDTLRAAILLGLEHFARDPEDAKRQLARIHERDAPRS